MHIGALTRVRRRAPVVPAWVDAALSRTLQHHPPEPDNAVHCCYVSDGVQKMVRQSAAQMAKRAKKRGREPERRRWQVSVALSVTKIKVFVKARLVAHQDSICPTPRCGKHAPHSSARVPSTKNGDAVLDRRRAVCGPTPAHITCPTRRRGIDVDFAHLTEKTVSKLRGNDK